MATSHGDAGGAGGAGGALVAMSAASAEVVRPATMSNGKATFFITIPFVYPLRRGPRIDAKNAAKAQTLRPPAHWHARYELHKFF